MVAHLAGKLLIIYICNFHVLSHFLLIYICKLHWNFLKVIWLRALSLLSSDPQANLNMKLIGSGGSGESVDGRSYGLLRVLSSTHPSNENPPTKVMRISITSRYSMRTWRVTSPSTDMTQRHSQHLVRECVCMCVF
jgi:hypothetical protein